MPTSSEGKSFSNISGNTPAFALTGGKYAVNVVFSGAGSVKLQAQCGDGLTWVSLSAVTDIATSPGYGTVDLPPGQYRFTVATVTAAFCAVTRVPY